MSPTTKSVADSMAAWSSLDRASFNQSEFWVLKVDNPTGTSTVSPSEAKEFLGSSISSNSKDVTSRLIAKGSSVGAKLGAVASEAHDPCEP